MRVKTIVLSMGILTIACMAAFAYQDPAQPAPAKRWYKGNTHTHSLWSDGNDFPEMIVDWYRSNGYDFLALSDHNVLSQGERWWNIEDVVQRAGTDTVITKYHARFDDDWIDTRMHDGNEQVRLKTLTEFRPLFEKPGAFLLVQGEEITDSFARLPVHMNAFNIQELITPQGGDSVREVMANNLKAVREQEAKTGEPILHHLNHPNFGWGVTAEDIAHVIDERFFEVFNGHPGVRHQGDDLHPPVERLWDIANTIRLLELNAPPLLGLATDDSHHYHGNAMQDPAASSSGRGWIMVRAGELTPAALIEAMRAGDFYGSSGVTLRDVAFDAQSRTLRIEVEPQEDAEYEIHFIGTLENTTLEAEDVFDETTGRPLTRKYKGEIGQILQSSQGSTATYQLTGEELYVRAVVRSNLTPINPVWEGQVQQAWTQPVGWRAEVGNGTDESH